MVIRIDKNTGKIFAELKNDKGVEVYKCNISICRNPVCKCGNITLELVSVQEKERQLSVQNPYSVEIDVYKKTLNYIDESKVPHEELLFARQFLSRLDDDDFNILHSLYHSHKNKITEKESYEAIDTNFDYYAVEETSLMYDYNDILPYGDTLRFTLNGTHYLFLDQYCIKPKCSCSETILNIYYVNTSSEAERELCAFLVNYKNRKWEKEGAYSSGMDITTIKAAVELQKPDFYERLKKRHERLRAIYEYNKKRHHTPKQDIPVPKVGRNDPCPCGSGKKYKKCCG